MKFVFIVIMITDISEKTLIFSIHFNISMDFIITNLFFNIYTWQLF